ncbi:MULTISPECIES: TRAP transporter large permease [Jonquetella]|uniref:TRAP transporter, DctM subunit n=1 Tax=Jonquetella anthropi DSM 22815 TaxID=885272 RepID=H0UIT0_9BACT|nr:MULTISPECIES: TRAP transporter large permease [Jonquetella]EEX48953.1 TRAP transporter, DctM subunit [Jonquetella anthropi E3_33 E1]EHM12724.1 TRAP transporter, DctM subunit [Jonquetella anthropi DSM 22815]ERL23449.1 TRAP transporter, DctM subunit [Jonquetella sp. BV3C21]
MLWIVGLFAVFLLGVPIAFSLGAVTLTGLLGTGLPMQVTVQQMIGGVDNFAFIAIPLFILAGNLMAVGGISKRITDFSESLVGHWPGGLGMVAIVASMIFAAVTGSAIAATAAIGALLISEMLSKGYSAPYAASLVATSGSIGPIIPPSIPLVVYGVIVSSSIAKLFMGGMIPGLLMGFFLMLANWLISRRRGYVGRAKRASFKELRQGFKDALLALIMPVIIVGGIVGGVFTPTESASVAVAYSLVLGGLVYRELSWKSIWEAFVSAAVTNGVILTVLMTARLFIWFMTVQMIPQSIAAALLSVIHTKWGALLVMNVILLIAGTFIDTTSAITIFVPLFLPLVKTFGIDLVHFGVIVAVNLTIGMCTPPLGVCLFVSCEIAKTSLREMFKDLMIMLIPLLAVLLLTTYVPSLVLWLPNALGL